MTARVLVVDDVFANIRLLEARLSAEYFTVVSAMSGPQALEICERGECDIVLLDVMMPGMDGYEVCRRLKSAPTTAHLPVVMVTALDSPSDRLQGLQAGADDFLTKPINEIALLTRVRSLVRLKHLTDELRSRSAGTNGLGLPDALVSAAAEDGHNGRVLLIEDRPNAVERIVSALAQHHVTEVEASAENVVSRLNETGFDVVVFSMAIQGADPLRLISQIRSRDRFRNLPILVIVDAVDDPRLSRALDMGVNDYLVRPVDRNELIARATTQIRKKRYQDRLRENLQASMELAIIDPLTRLHNRRYLQTQLATLVNDDAVRGAALSLMVLDIDHFKQINDQYGHDCGDEVLRESADRLRDAVRSIDIVARFGGEEFVIVLPDTDTYAAERIAERVRSAIDMRPFSVSSGTKTIHVTASIGVATRSGSGVSGDALFKLADTALYEAKRNGRNCVRQAA